MSHQRRILITIACLLLFNIANAEFYKGDIDSVDFVKSSLICVGPGKDIYSSCGHIGLRMECPKHNLDVCFSYLVAENPMMILNTLCGNAKQGLYVEFTKDYIGNYKQENREIVQYELNLTADEKKQLWRLLDEESAKGGCREFDYINHGCALGIVSKVKESLILDTLRLFKNDEMSLNVREIIAKPLSKDFWSAFWISFLLGESLNSVFPESYRQMIPNDLANLWERSYFVDIKDESFRPVILRRETLNITNESDSRNLFSPLMLALVLLTCCTCVIIVRILKVNNSIIKHIVSGFDWAMLLLITLLGFLILIISVFCPLYGTEQNMLIMIYNFIPIIGVLLTKKSAKASLCLYILYIGGVLSYLFISQVDMNTQSVLFLPHWILACDFLIWIVSRITILKI